MMLAHSTDAAEGLSTGEQQQVGRCAAFPLLALSLVNKIDIVFIIVILLLSVIGSCFFWYRRPDKLS